MWTGARLFEKPLVSPDLDGGAPMIIDVALLGLGLAVLLAGGKALVGGASELAGTLGVSELTIGMTVVAFGTSAPELAVNTLAAIEGDTTIAFGNIIGSNITNAALVIGVAAVMRPILMESVIVSREIPMMMLATAAALILGLDRIRGSAEGYDRADGLMLLLLFSVFLYYSISEVVGQRREDPMAVGAVARAPTHGEEQRGRALWLTGGGLVGLVVGAQLTVTYAVSLAEALEIPQVVIALTVVALGTSLPELTTSVVAASRGMASMAVGNVVGSNIFNLLFILGSTVIIRPVEVPASGGFDLAAMAAFSAVLLLLSRTRKPRIGRATGWILIASYLGYVISRFQT